MTNKKTKIIFAVAVLELILLAVCIILLVNKPSNETNPMLPSYMVVDPTLSLNDGKFYYNGDTDNIYYDVRNGNMQLVFNEEKYKKYLRESSDSWSENEIDKSYRRNLEFWKEPLPYNIWVWYDQSPESDMLFLSFETFDIEMGDRTVPAPGGGYSYIDENNFGSVGKLQNDGIFTRVSE